MLIVVIKSTLVYVMDITLHHVDTMAERLTKSILCNVIFLPLI